VQSVLRCCIVKDMVALRYGDGLDPVRVAWWVEGYATVLEKDYQDESAYSCQTGQI
jgi:hypothetical protein